MAVIDEGRVSVDNAITYRPDIDGLRAVAVLSVVLFHAGVSFLPGGFTGVDIFFVISGCLIGGQIYRERIAGGFNIGAFYARRVRRILPALFALLLTVYAIGWVLMTPLELKELGKEAFGTVFGISNLYFYTGGGYFSPGADYSPLLMTWSLGVEEQFYIIFPYIALLLIYIKRIPVQISLFLITVLIFFASVVLTDHLQRAAFYLLPTRFWELSLGALVAIIPKLRLPAMLAKPQWSELAAVVGAGLLYVSIARYQPNFAFPGWFALWATVGTALLIMTPQSVVNRHILAARPMIWIGKISYSWYLWHWPLFYLNRIVAGEGAGLGPAALLLLSFALGALSWRWIEQPFRRRVLPQHVVLLRYAGAAMVMAIPPLVFYMSAGAPARLPGLARAFAEDARTTQADVCLARVGVSDVRMSADCIGLPSSSGQRRLMVVGDSHGSSIAQGFSKLASANGLAFGQMTKSACIPLWGYVNEWPGRPDFSAECLEYQRQAFTYIARHKDIEYVVLAARWSEEMMVTAKAGTASIPSIEPLKETIARLQALGRKVILVQDVPVFRFDPYTRVIGELMPARFALARWIDPSNRGHFSARPDKIEWDRGRDMIAQIKNADPSIILVDPHRSLCDGNGCRFRGETALYYFDNQHLTQSGAREAVKIFPLRN